jgi:hypothetical protein
VLFVFSAKTRDIAGIKNYGIIPGYILTGSYCPYFKKILNREGVVTQRKPNRVII